MKQMVSVTLVKLCNNRVSNRDLHRIHRRVDCRFVPNGVETPSGQLVASNQTCPAYSQISYYTDFKGGICLGYQY
jgi:hypothetical protein